MSKKLKSVPRTISQKVIDDPETKPIKATNSNYGLFFLNLDNDKLKPIRDQFASDLQHQTRRVVLGFTRSDVIRELIAEESKHFKKSSAFQKFNEKSPQDIYLNETSPKIGNKKITPINTEKPDHSLFNESKHEEIADESMKLEQKHFIQKMKEYIENNIQKTQVITKFLEAENEFDLLKYWKELRDQNSAEKNKDKSKKTDTKTSKRESKAAVSVGTVRKEKDKKDRKVVKQETADDSQLKCKLREGLERKLNAKSSSKLHLSRNKDVQKLKYIEDHPPAGLQTYIIILGNFENEVYFKLLDAGYDIRAIINFFPKSDLVNSKKDTTNDILKDIEDLKTLDWTKNIQIKNLFIKPISKCLSSEFQKDIYDELSWLLYDIDGMRYQHRKYLDNLIVFDIEDHYPYPYYPVTVLQNSDLPEHALDIHTVPEYLDYLLEMVHERLLGTENFEIEETYDYGETEAEGEEEHNKHYETTLIESPFLSDYCNNILIEYQNDLLQNTMASGIDLKHYYKSLKYFRNNETYFNLSKENSKSAVNKLDLITLFDRNEFGEAITAAAFIQRLRKIAMKCDFKDSYFHPSLKVVLKVFGNAKRCFYENHKTSVINTKICFRDYCEYVASKIEVWNQNQEINEAEAGNVLRSSHQQAVDHFSTLSYSDFIRKRSLKESSGREQLIEPSNEELNLKQKKVRSPEEKTQTKINEKERKEGKKTKKVGPVFCGYNFGNVYLKLDSYTATYESGLTFVTLDKEIWSNNQRRFNLKIKHANNHIFHGRVYNSADNLSRIRIETKTNIIIDVVYDLLLVTGEGEEEELNESGNYEPVTNYPKVAISWPATLRIENIFDYETATISEFRQFSSRPSSKEKSRFIYPNGTIIVSYKDDRIRVLTSNGTLYETGPSMPEYEGEVNNSSTDIGMSFEQQKYLNEIEYLKRYDHLLDSDNFLLTTAEGYNFKIQNGFIISKNQKFLNVEWYDFVVGERYSAREDGVRTLTSEHIMVCYYPDGTVIKSYTHGRTLYRYFDELDNSESFVISPGKEEIHSASAIAVTESMLKELVNIASDELFIYTDTGFVVEHECYATAHFIKEDNSVQDRVELYSPGGVNLSFIKKQLLIDLDGELNLSCSKDACIIQAPSENNTEDDKDDTMRTAFKAVINFPAETDLPIFTFTNENAQIFVDHNFNWVMNVESDHVCGKQKELTEIILEDNLDGYELFSCDEVSKIKQMISNPQTIICESEDLLLILECFQNFDERFRLPVLWLNDLLMKFEGQGFECKSNANMELRCKNPVMKTMRCFFKLHNIDRDPDCPPRNFYLCTSLGRKYASELQNIEAKVIGILNLGLQRGLSQWYEESLLHSEENPEKLVQTNIKWRIMQENVEQQNRRTKMYKTMLRENFCSKYHDFHEAGNHVQCMDVCKYSQDLKLPNISSKKCCLKKLTETENIICNSQDSAEKIKDEVQNIDSHVEIESFLNGSSNDLEMTFPENNVNEFEIECESKFIPHNSKNCACPATKGLKCFCTKQK